MIEIKNDTWFFSGNLNYQKVPQFLNEMENCIWTKPVKLDFRDVEEIDTSLLSVIFEFQRQAKKHDTTIVLLNIPENLRVLAKLYSVENYLFQTN